MGLNEASQLLGIEQLSLAGILLVMLTYFLIPTFIILNTIYIFRKLKRQIDLDFESPKKLEERLGNINVTKDTRVFNSLTLEFDNKGRIINKKGR